MAKVEHNQIVTNLKTILQKRKVQDKGFTNALREGFKYELKQDRQLSTDEAYHVALYAHLRAINGLPHDQNNNPISYSDFLLLYT